MNSATGAWQVIMSGTSADGAEIELRYAVFGKGRARLEQWRIYRDGSQVGYASTPEDAATNYQRALSGLVRDAETGRYVPASPHVGVGEKTRTFESAS